MNRDYRRAERGPRPTQEDLERYARAARPRSAQPVGIRYAHGPCALADAAAGRLFCRPCGRKWRNCWTAGLSPEIWANSNDFGTEQHLAVRQTIDRMEEKLRGAVRDLHPQDYASSQGSCRAWSTKCCMGPPRVHPLRMFADLGDARRSTAPAAWSQEGKETFREREHID